MRVLAVLQCAYGNTPGRRQQLRDERLWLEGLWGSHTGRRLKEMLPDRAEVCIVNASPWIGSESGALFPPEAQHIQDCIDRFSPDVVLACGKVAQRGVSMVGHDYVAAPHPAWRALTKEQTSRIKHRLESLLGEIKAI